MLEMMRTFRYILLAGLFLFIGVVEGVGQVEYGSGTEADPYIVDPEGVGTYSWGGGISEPKEYAGPLYFKMETNCTITNKMIVTSGTVYLSALIVRPAASLCPP